MAFCLMKIYQIQPYVFLRALFIVEKALGIRQRNDNICVFLGRNIILLNVEENQTSPNPLMPI